MPAKDKFHDAVKAALAKAGWAVEPEPFTINFDRWVLGTSDQGPLNIATSLRERQIVVLCADIISSSDLDNLFQMIGRWIMLQHALSRATPARTLYAAVSHHNAGTLLNQRAVEKALADVRMSLLIIDDEELCVRHYEGDRVSIVLL